MQGGFPKRDIVREAIDGLPDDSPELELSRLLDEYRAAREERFARTTRRTQAAAGLLVVALQQRLLSSIEAFARSLEVHRATAQWQWEKGQTADASAANAGAGDLQLLTRVPDADDERAGWTAEELEAEEAVQIEAATAAAESEVPEEAAVSAMWRREQELLGRMAAIAGKSRHAPDAKARRLVDWIRENLCPDLPPFGRPAKGTPKWNDRRVLIFTENREGTKRHLKTILEQAIEGTDRADERIEVIDGLTSSVRRFTDRFWARDWPGGCRPRVFYDPRSLDADGPAGVLHAKAVVADDELVLVTSANLTEAALDRNIELGVLVRDRALAASGSSHFQVLIDRGLLRPLPMD